VVQDFKDKECTDAEPLERRMCAIKKMGELDAPNATIQRLLGALNGTIVEKGLANRRGPLAS
jgi:hypothetical protein